MPPEILDMSTIQRRKALKLIGGISGIGVLSGCLDNSDETVNIEWTNSGLTEVTLDTLISVSAFVEGVHRGEQPDDIYIDLRMVKSDGTLLGNWISTTAGDIYPGEKFIVSANFELSRSSFVAENNDLIEIQKGVDVIFSQQDSMLDQEHQNVKKLTDKGEVVYVRGSES